MSPGYAFGAAHVDGIPSLVTRGLCVGSVDKILPVMVLQEVEAVPFKEN